MVYKSSVLHGKLDNKGKLTKKGRQVVLFERYDGFGLPAVVLRQVKSVEIHYKGVVYNADKEMFRDHSIQYLFGDELQYVLPRKYWRIQDQGVLL